MDKLDGVSIILFFRKKRTKKTGVDSA